MSNRIYSKRARNPGWLVRAARWVGTMRRKIAYYRFYRGIGNNHKQAWEKACNTI